MAKWDGMTAEQVLESITGYGGMINMVVGMVVDGDVEQLEHLQGYFLQDDNPLPAGDCHAFNSMVWQFLRLLKGHYQPLGDQVLEFADGSALYSNHD